MLATSASALRLTEGGTMLGITTAVLRWYEGRGEDGRAVASSSRRRREPIGRSDGGSAGEPVEVAWTWWRARTA